MSTTEILHRCLEDLERRIDHDEEQAYHAAWSDFLHDRIGTGIFIAPRRTPHPPLCDWPMVYVNDTLYDKDTMLLQQFKGVSGTLAAGSGNPLDVRCNCGVGIMTSQLGCEVVVMDRGQGNTPTTGLAVSFRAKYWTEIFHTLQNQPQFTPAAHLLLLTRLPEHAYYLRHWYSGKNWATMELSGLTAIATRFPEFKKAQVHLAYASKVLPAELSKQVYPDGVQMELTTSYHWVALRNFEQYANLCKDAGLPVSEAYDKRLVAMYDYLAGTLRPDGAIPLNNDSDRHDLREILLKAADRYKRPDWRFVATNGKEGKVPAEPPSRFYPYAGQLISRSSWAADAQWSFFDVGPLGLAHAHTDKLHLSVHVAGRDLLVDSGRFAYQGSLAPFRKQYGWDSRAHNVVLFDNRDQNQNPRSVKKPLSKNDYLVTQAFDYSRGSVNHYKGLKPGDASHTRALMYIRGHFWVVVDRLTTKAPRKATTLWHWNPDCTVKAEDGRVFSADQGKINLSLQPVGDSQWTVEMVKGLQKGSEYQGWYSEEYNKIETNPVALCSTQVNDEATYAWLLIPGHGDVPVLATSQLAITNDRVTLRVTTPDGKTCDLVIPITEPAAEASVTWDKR